MRPALLVLLAACGNPDPIDTTLGTDTDRGTDADTSRDTEADTDDLDTEDPNCSDDELENNDTLETAAPLAIPTTFEGTTCVNDLDYFSVDVEERCVVTADLSYSAERGDLDLLLYRDGVGIEGSYDSPDFETLTWTADSDDTWVLGVEGRTGAENDYTLAISQDCGAQCTDDDREPNNSAETATDLIDFVNVLARACAGDDDWFRAQAGSGCLVNYTLTSVVSGAAGVDIYDSRGLIGEGFASGSQESVRVIASGDTWLKVTASTDTNYGLDGSSNTCFPNAFTCPSDDPFEPNNTTAIATLVSWGANFGAATCGNDDWYRLTDAPGCTGTATVRFTHSNGDIDIELTDRNGNALVSSEGSGNSETVSYALTGSTTYLHVFGYNDASNGYTVETSLSCP